MSTELILIQQLFSQYSFDSELFPPSEKTLSAYSEECLLKHNLHFIKHCLNLATEIWVMSCNFALRELTFYIMKYGAFLHQKAPLLSVVAY